MNLGSITATRTASRSSTTLLSRTVARMGARGLERVPAPMRPSLAIKRGLDIAAAAAGLIATAPLLGGASLAIRASMGSPILFRQVRPGLHGKPFELIKLRTMRAAKPGEGYEHDSQRLARLGQFLRSSSIDELPSLWNVLRGEMSIVGPRPLLMEYLDRYTPEQARRHDVKPGLTGWSQINGRNARDWDEKLALDSWYAQNWSLWLDLRILVKTPLPVLRRDGVSHPGAATAPLFRGSEGADGEPGRPEVSLDA